MLTCRPRFTSLPINDAFRQLTARLESQMPKNRIAMWNVTLRRDNLIHVL